MKQHDSTRERMSELLQKWKYLHQSKFSRTTNAVWEERQILLSVHEDVISIVNVCRHYRKDSASPLSQVDEQVLSLILDLQVESQSDLKSGQSIVIRAYDKFLETFRLYEAEAKTVHFGILALYRRKLMKIKKNYRGALPPSFERLLSKVSTDYVDEAN